MTVQKKTLTLPEARQKIYRYCTYQERCHQEVRKKLYEMGLRTNDVDEIIVHLITEGFLNEERFAKAYVGGKFRMKNWGRIKIIHSLEGKGISPNCIKAGLSEIDEQDYSNTLQKILCKKMEESKGSTIYERRNNVAKYAIQKGFEPELVWNRVREVMPD